jgi:dipeptidyl aminopeptidase/acylaminoacyl peptidase
MTRSAILFLFSCTIVTAPAWAQGTAADYERSTSLFRRMQNKVFPGRVTPHWLAGGKRFWYRNDLQDGKRDFVLVDAEAGKREPAFDHAKLAAALAKTAGEKITADRLPLSDLRFSDDAATISFRAAGKSWRLDRKTQELRLREDEKPAEQLRRQAGRSSRTALQSRPAEQDGSGEPSYYSDESGEPSYTGSLPAQVVSSVMTQFRTRRRQSNTSPDGKWAVIAKDHNVYLREEETKKETQLSKEGKESDSYTGEVYWSPDSKKVVAMRWQPGFDRKIHIIESSPTAQLQARLHTLSYRKPGDAVPFGKPHLFEAATGKEVPVSDELFANPWSINRVRWEADSKRFTFEFNQRGHQVLRVMAVDAETGKASALVDETSKTFIDYAHKYRLDWLNETNELIWMSERDGWNHLYLYDAKTGKVKNQITKGEWVVRGVERVDAKNRQVWFRAAGIHPGQDPYYIHFARVNFDGTGLVILTEGDGTHEIEYSPDRQFFVDTYSRVDMAPVTELRRTSDGKLVCKLESASLEALKATGWQAPERFTAKGRDGKTDIYGVIFRPTTFDPTKKYPVIEHIYAGPQGAFVPKGFRSFYHHQSMAELGFVVVQMDGMGTSYRSKAFHDVCCKNLADAGFPDRIAWIKAAAQKYPCMDLTKVGIWGGSAGGQSSTGALLFHGDFYKVAVSDCGCHDNRVDKIWWNELWMGWPIGPHYREQANATNANKLQGKLMLVVGELDRNVDPASTMQVVNALVKANKDFDLLVIPGAGHGACETPYGRRRRADFFVRHLLGVEPRRATK